MNINRIHVLHVLGKFQIGGAETFVMNLYKNMDMSKYKFDFVVHGNEVGEYEKDVLKRGSKVYRVPKYNFFNHKKYVKAWRDFFENHPEYTIVHDHVRSTASIVLRIAKEFKLKTIVHSHSISNGKGLKSLLKLLLQKKIPRYSDVMLACSQEAGDWLYGKNSHFIVTKNGINTDDFKYDVTQRKRIREELKLKKDDIVVGHIGRFVNEKNHAFLIELAEMFANCGKDNYKFVFCGAGPLKESVIRSIEEKHLSNIIILDTRKDVFNLYNVFDIFVLPSKFEGLGIVLIEAQYNGLPCIASNFVPDESKISSNFVKEELDCLKWKKLIESQDLNSRDILKIESIKAYDIKETCAIMDKIYSD